MSSDSTGNPESTAVEQLEHIESSAEASRTFVVLVILGLGTTSEGGLSV